jgi:hypothetical protein
MPTLALVSDQEFRSVYLRLRPSPAASWGRLRHRPAPPLSEASLFPPPTPRSPRVGQVREEDAERWDGLS